MEIGFSSFDMSNPFHFNLYFNFGWYIQCPPPKKDLKIYEIQSTAMDFMSLS